MRDYGGGERTHDEPQNVSADWHCRIGVADCDTSRARGGTRRRRASPSLPLYKVVYDTRFAASVAFGRRAASLGEQVHPIQGDMTSLWYHDIYHRWKQSPVAIAGLTAQGPLFCFERLAWDQGLRVVFRAEHGAAEHSLSGPESLLIEARDALASADWAAEMATVLTRCPSGRAEIGSATVACLRSDGSPADEPLYSWVIAPAVRA